VKHASITEILTQADVVSLHCPLTPETANLIDKAAFEEDEEDGDADQCRARRRRQRDRSRSTALQAKEIAGAAMDVSTRSSRCRRTASCFGLDNLVVTPHLAAIASDNFAPVVKRMFDEHRQHVSRGEPVPPLDLVV
jgi:phosphoglycerate dehydrogenase-like enzyme